MKFRWTSTASEFANRFVKEVGSAATELLIVGVAVAIGAGTYFVVLQPKLSGSSERAETQNAYELASAKYVKAIASLPGGGIDLAEAGASLQAFANILSRNASNRPACAELWSSACNGAANYAACPAAPTGSTYVLSTSSGGTVANNADGCSFTWPAIKDTVRNNAIAKLNPAKWVVVGFVQPASNPPAYTIKENDFYTGPAAPSEAAAIIPPTVTNTPTPTATTAGGPTNTPTSVPTATPTRTPKHIHHITAAPTTTPTSIQTTVPPTYTSTSVPTLAGTTGTGGHTGTPVGTGGGYSGAYTPSVSDGGHGGGFEGGHTTNIDASPF